MSKTSINIARLRLQLARRPRQSANATKHSIQNRELTSLIRARNRLRKIADMITRASSRQNQNSKKVPQVNYEEMPRMLPDEIVLSEPENVENWLSEQVTQEAPTYQVERYPLSFQMEMNSSQQKSWRSKQQITQETWRPPPASKIPRQMVKPSPIQGHEPSRPVYPSTSFSQNKLPVEMPIQGPRANVAYQQPEMSFSVASQPPRRISHYSTNKFSSVQRPVHPDMSLQNKKSGPQKTFTIPRRASVMEKPSSNYQPARKQTPLSRQLPSSARKQASLPRQVQQSLPYQVPSTVDRQVSSSTPRQDPLSTSSFVSSEYSDSSPLLSAFAKKSTSNNSRKTVPRVWNLPKPLQMPQSSQHHQYTQSSFEADQERVKDKRPKDPELLSKNIEVKPMYVRLNDVIKSTPLYNYQTCSSLAFANSIANKSIVIKCLKSCEYKGVFSQTKKLREEVIAHFNNNHHRDSRWHGFCSRCGKQIVDPKKDDRGKFTLRNEIEHIIECHTRPV